LYLEIADQKTGRKQLVLIRKMIQGETIELSTLLEESNCIMTTQALTEKVEVLSLNMQNFSTTF